MNNLYKNIIILFFMIMATAFNSTLIAQNFNVTAPQQCNPSTGGTEIVTFNNAPPNANGDATIVISYRGDLNSSTETIDFFGEGGLLLGTSNIISSQCTGIDSSTYVVPFATFLNWASDGTVVITAVATSAVNSGLGGCINGSSFCVTVRLEYPVSTADNDIGISALDSPGVFCAGSQNLYAEVSNYGTNQVNNFTVNWAFNGVLEAPIPVTQLLDTAAGTGASQTFVFLGTKNITSKDTLVVWTSNPNGATDTVTANDSLTRILTPSLNGSLTVGTSGSADYSSFSALVTDLNAVGVCGPVNVSVEPGTYNEFIDLGPIVGISSTNTLTIDGGDTSLVNLTHDGAIQPATVKLAGAEWVTIKNMTISSTSTSSDSWGVLLMMGADHNTIDSCNIVLPIAGTDDRSGILASSSETTDFGEGNNANYTTISNCVITGGDRSLSFEGGGTGNWNVGNKFINNTLRFADDYGFYGDDQDSLLFQGNTISDLQNGTFADGFYSFDFENLTFRENIITAPDWAFYASDLNVDGIGGRSLIANNFITSTGDYGLRILDGENIDIFHNTIFGEPAIFLDYSFDGLDSIDARNNIFISNADYAFEIDVNTGTTGVTTLDNNIYETGGTNFVLWEGTQYPDLPTWQASFPQFNLNSYEGDPIFFAPGDFHVVGPLANNQGSPTPINIDLDGDARSATTPDIGADEYALIPDDAGVVSIDSPTVFCPGTFDVYARIANFGTNQITSATVNWSVDGVLQAPGTFSGLLDTLGGTGSRFGLAFLGSFNFSTNNPYAIEAWTTNPNGVTDANTTNDSLATQIQSNLPAPTNIATTALSATQATLTWTGGSANTWLWANVPAGQTLTGSGTPVSSASATVTGLTSETGYDFYVREVCATGDTSLWAGPFFYITPFQCPPNAFCFLTGGATGQFGPSQAQVNVVYSGTNLAGNVTVLGGIQDWTVPNGGLYSIEAYGAQGGGSAGGRGAYVSGEFLLNSGDVMSLLVGQQGTENDNGTGGGGGSYVVLNSNLLAVAGGGGGNNGTTNALCDAQATANGQDGFGVSGFGIGGTAGNAGASEDRGQGGAGWLQDGPPLTQSTADVAALRFNNGGDGGYHTTSPGGLGGFGGGGGSWNTGFRGSGGGGGYSGGGAGYQSSNATQHGGGGAGSFNSGSNQVNTGGTRFGNGVIIVRTLSSGAPDDIGVTGLDSPAVFCPGPQDVYVNINNFGTTQVTSATVNWSVDGLIQTPVTFNGLLDTIGGTGNTTAQVNLGSFAFSTNNPYNIMSWTSNPNGVADTVNNNDTISTVVQSNLPPPTGLGITAVSAGQVEFSWNPGSLANSWLWVVVPPGNPPTGIGTATSVPFDTAFGLASNQDFDLYVREVCPTGDTSLWAGPFTFSTCVISPPPYFIDFNGVAPNTPPCWTTNNPGAVFTSSACAGSLGEHLVVEGVSGVFAETPTIDASGLTSMRIQYRYRAGDPNCGETPDGTDVIAVEYFDGTTWQTIATHTGGGSSPTVWTDTTYTITTGLTSNFKYRFFYVSGSGSGFDTYHFDNLSFLQSPDRDLSLEQVIGLNTGCGLGTNESFTVSVKNDGSLDQDTFDIEYSVNGGPYLVGASITSNLIAGQSQNYTITGVDLSSPGQNCVSVRVSLPNDQAPNNDSLPQICIFNQAVPTIDSVINGEVCNGGSITLQVNFTGNNLNWFDDAALTNQVNSGPTYTANFTQTTVLYLQAINSNGCTAPIQTITAEVNFTPTVDYTRSINNCTVDFTSSVSTNTDSVRWEFGDGVGTSTQLNPTYTYSSAQSFLVTLTAYDGTCAKDTTKAIFVNCQVGLKANPWAQEIKMFPNPSKGKVNLNIPNAESKVLITVIDIKGQVVYRQEYSSGNTFEEVIDLSHLDGGSYFVNMYSGDRSAVKKLTIE